MELSQRDYDEDFPQDEEDSFYKVREERKQMDFTVESHFKGTMIHFTSAKQIIEECEKRMLEFSEFEEERKVMNFRELLSWKMPEHFCSTTSANNKQYNRFRVQVGEGMPHITNQINLYKLDFVTQRLKEQRVSFCGIVTHIK